MPWWRNTLVCPFLRGLSFFILARVPWIFLLALQSMLQFIYKKANSTDVVYWNILHNAPWNCLYVFKKHWLCNCTVFQHLQNNFSTLPFLCSHWLMLIQCEQMGRSLTQECWCHDARPVLGYYKKEDWNRKHWGLFLELLIHHLLHIIFQNNTVIDCNGNPRFEEILRCRRKNNNRKWNDVPFHLRWMSCPTGNVCKHTGPCHF